MNPGSENYRLAQPVQIDAILHCEIHPFSRMQTLGTVGSTSRMEPRNYRASGALEGVRPPKVCRYRTCLPGNISVPTKGLVMHLW